MITEDKVTELFCMANDFCKFFDAMMENMSSIMPLRYQTGCFTIKEYDEISDLYLPNHHTTVQLRQP